MQNMFDSMWTCMSNHEYVSHWMQRWSRWTAGSREEKNGEMFADGWGDGPWLCSLLMLWWMTKTTYGQHKLGPTGVWIPGLPLRPWQRMQPPRLTRDVPSKWPDWPLRRLCRYIYIYIDIDIDIDIYIYNYNIDIYIYMFTSIALAKTLIVESGWTHPMPSTPT